MANDHLENIAIVGCGLAGLTLAISLAEKGITSTIYERESEENLGGMGIQITPNGSEILAKLGLQETVRKISTPCEQITIADGVTSKSLFSMELSRYNKEGNLGYIACHRGELTKILCVRARKLGVRFCFERNIILGGSSTENGNFRSRDGSEHSSSLLVGADGYSSSISQIVNPTVKKAMPDFIALRGLVPTVSLDKGGIRSGVNLYMYPAKHLVTYCIDKGKYLNFVVVRPLEGKDSRNDDLETVTSRFGNFPFLEKLISQASEVRTNYLFKGYIKPTWYNGKVVLCGDALHPMPPFLAQGGNMAIEDGWVLASTLLNSSNPTQAFNLFKSERQFRLKRIVRLSNSQGWINHLKGGAIHQLRNMTLKLAASSFPSLITSRYSWIYKSVMKTSL